MVPRLHPLSQGELYLSTGLELLGSCAGSALDHVVVADDALHKVLRVPVVNGQVDVQANRLRGKHDRDEFAPLHQLFWPTSIQPTSSSGFWRVSMYWAWPKKVVMSRPGERTHTFSRQL